MRRLRWWHGVALVPLAPLLKLLSRVGFRSFRGASAMTSGPSGGPVIAAFIFTVVTFWSAVLVAGVVLASLVGDIRALEERAWSPGWWWTAAGVCHLAGVLVWQAFALSVPALSYYLYRRHTALGAP